MKEFGTVGIIGRFKPFHLGGAAMLENACKKSEKVLIGIGSCNRYNLRNPFTAYETREMINAFLAPRFNNYEFVNVPDYGHLPQYENGKKWKEMVLKKFKEADVFLCGNPYVINLLEDKMHVVHPASIIPRKDWVRVNATQVRYGMALNGKWQDLVPKEVAKYIEERRLDKRFRERFGPETLQQIANASEDLLNRDLSSKMEKYLVGGVK